MMRITQAALCLLLAMGAPGIDAAWSQSSTGTPTPELTRYVGKEPFTRIAGVSFLSDPIVRSAVTRVVPDAAIRKWLLDPAANPWKPVFAKGSMLVAMGCQQHGCDQRSWAILIDTRTRAARICFEANEVTRWYSAKGVRTVSGDCPFDENSIDG